MRSSDRFQNALPLVRHLLVGPTSQGAVAKGFPCRFSHLFNDSKLLLATAIHPRFRFKVMEQLNSDAVHKIRDQLIRDICQEITAVNPNQESINSSAEEDADENGDFYKASKLC